MNFRFLYSTVSTLKPGGKRRNVSDSGDCSAAGCLALLEALTDGRDGLHEFILLQLKKDGGLSRPVESQSHDSDLHLWADVDSVVLKEQRIPQLSGCAVRLRFGG